MSTEEAQATESNHAESQVTENVTPQDNNQQAQPAANQRSDKPAGYDPIDETTASPEEIKERVTYLYSQVKTGERTTKELKKVAAEQSRMIAELTQGYNGVVNHLQEKSITDNEAHWEGQMQQAFERGDNKAFLDAQNKLMDLRVEKRVRAVTQPQQVRQSQPQTPAYASAAQIANEALEGGELSPTEYRATEAWQNEKDENGQLLRPWAYADSPTHSQALRESQAVWANPRFTTNEQRLAEVDRRMGVTRRTASQSVMGGSLTTNKKPNNIIVSPDMAKIAIKTKFGGPKAKSDADHIEAWRQQLASVKSQRGVRK